MKTQLYLLSAIIFLSGACTTIQKLADEGRYDDAIVKAAKKLKGKSLKDPKVVKLLESTFNKANERDLRILTSLMSTSDWRSNEKVLRVVKLIDQRQNLLSPFLPLTDKQGYEAHFNLINTNQIKDVSKNSIVNDLYNEGMTLMDESKKNDYKLAREAYQRFVKLESYRPDYEGINTLKQNALQQGKSHVLVNVLDRADAKFPSALVSKLKNLLSAKGEAQWVAYYFNTNENINFDYTIDVTPLDIKVSPEKLEDTYHHFSEQVQDGFTYKFDKKGNVLKDSSGNDIKVPKYVNARATIREINQEKEAIMDVQLTFFNKTNGKIIKQVPLQEKTSFANCAVSFEGDKRAIPSNWNLRIGGYLQDFPQDVLMVDQLLKQIAKRSINKMQELESQL